MSGTTLFSTSRRYDNSPDPVDRRNRLTENGAQGDGPPPTSHSEEKWLCDKPYKYSLASTKNPLEMCNEIIERQDERTCTQLRDEINFLMVVAGLFLAIVTAFTVESYKSLQEDKQDTTSVLLVEVVRLLNDTSAQGKAQLPKPFVPNHHDIVVNQLWFLSLILNLTAVAMGTFCLQWISAFSRGSDLKDKSILPHESLALRTLRYEGLVAWGVLHAPEALLLMVQLSIGLFTFGLIYFLWNVNNTTAIPSLVAVVLAGLVLFVMNLMPFVQSLAGVFVPVTLLLPQCPYKSPTSWLIQSVGNVLPYTFKLFLRLSQPDWTTHIIGRWLGSLSFPFTDFFWKKHDLFCARLREKRPQYSWDRGDPPLRYYGQGLLSAITHLIYEPDANELISTCLQDLRQIFSSAAHWQEFSDWQQNLSRDETVTLDEEFGIALDLLPPRFDSLPLQLNLGTQIRTDFMNALILQHLTRLNPKLATLLFHHRVELYIRTKNSSQYIFDNYVPSGDFGQSLECPLRDSQDVQELNLGEAVFNFSNRFTDPREIYVELKFQFLSCVDHLISIWRFNDLDLMHALAIVLIEEKFDPTASSNNEDLEVQSESDPQTPSSPSIGVYSELDPQTASSPSNGAHEENSELRAALTRLCSQMRKKLSDLPESAFQDKNYHTELQDALQVESTHWP
ncbi:hypothetical protein AGABI2DRAFT_113547 [Agaricus bisporus var. bisporus H97]|uniref:hypothetical protein n=1 Tax=Agaricus bisporus var. bisporus (strain H97 / ATCC MYA-4626 / FGSC 10389) TaxID=936046 RepID=UPI00029F67A8|nr:hypothetical protein AGABI2DRAFT_113547 [Agaricus bisporus var. bisporus H97]EKV50789.1 hypothetical protein AGABI2DRAFT_113547 [Agaricus bisporus var. bisporus H97]